MLSSIAAPSSATDRAAAAAARGARRRPARPTRPSPGSAPTGRPRPTPLASGPVGGRSPDRTDGPPTARGHRARRTSRAARARTRSGSWVAMTTVPPASRWSAMMSTSSAHVAGSWPNVGSSSSRIPGIQGECGAHAEPPLLAAGEGEGIGVREVGQVQPIEHPRRPLRRLGLRDAGAHQAVVHLVDDPAGDELVLRVLEHHPEGARDARPRPSATGRRAAVPSRPGRPAPCPPWASSQPCQAGQQGGLPRAGGTGDGDHLAGRRPRGRWRAADRPQPPPAPTITAPARLGAGGRLGRWEWSTQTRAAELRPRARWAPGLARAQGSITEPPSTSSTRSARASQASTRCSTTTTVQPWWSRTALDRGEDPAAAAGSRFAVGSSSRSRCGSATVAAATASSCCCPPLSRRVSVVSGHVQPALRPARLATVAQICAGGDGSVLQGEGDVVADPLHHDVALRLLLDQPDPRRRRVAPGADDKQPPGVPTLGQRPGQGGQHRRLARPRGAHQDHQLARLDRERRRRTARPPIGPGTGSPTRVR